MTQTEVTDKNLRTRREQARKVFERQGYTASQADARFDFDQYHLTDFCGGAPA